MNMHITKPAKGRKHTRSIPVLSLTARSCWHRKTAVGHRVIVIEVLHVGIVNDTVSEPSINLIKFQLTVISERSYLENRNVLGGAHFVFEVHVHSSYDIHHFIQRNSFPWKPVTTSFGKSTSLQKNISNCKFLQKGQCQQW